MKRITNILLYLAYLVSITFIVLEILLRIYHPFPIRLKGNKIVLGYNQVFHVSNRHISKLEQNVIHTKNSIGFRGAEIPDDFDQDLTIITVGGSTTECLFLGDKKDWTSLLGDKLSEHLNHIWINNAGFEGHSTFAHQILMDDFILKIKPKVVLFLTGINDVGIEKLRVQDEMALARNHQSTLGATLATYSEVFNLVRVIYLAKNAQIAGLNNRQIDFNHAPDLFLPDTLINDIFEKQKSHAANYKARVLQLVETCKSHHIEPIFITQPCVYGFGTDSLSGASLETIQIDDENNGLSGWKVLQLYNDQVRAVCEETNTHLVDLAEKMPKNSLYYYDFIHFTNLGCDKVSQIISDDLTTYLRERYVGYEKTRSN